MIVTSIEKTVTVEGKEVLVEIVRLGEDEGWTVAQAAEYLDVGVRYIQKSCAENMLRTNSSSHTVQALKEAGLVAFKAPTAMFLPKETIKALVKIIDTPAAWAIYNQLWETIENVVSLKDITSRVEECTLTTAQSTALITAVDAKAKAMGKISLTGMIIKDLKEEFGLNKTRHTFKDIPQKDFQKALDYVRKYSWVAHHNRAKA